MNDHPWVERTFGDALEWAAREYGDREAVVYGADRISFAQLAERVRAFARGLIAQGIAPGEHVALCLLYTSPSPRDKRQSRMPSSA